MCIRVEQQLKRKPNSKKEYLGMSSSSRKDYKREGFPSKLERHLKNNKKSIEKKKKKEKNIKKKRGHYSSECPKKVNSFCT